MTDYLAEMGRSDRFDKPPTTLDQLVQWARLEAPLECCGLIGRLEPEGTLRTYPCRNVAEDPTLTFLIDPRDQYQGEKAIKRAGEFVGTYHSHCVGAPYPSPTDLEKLSLWPEAWHFIVSLRDEVPVIGAYRIAEERILDGHFHLLNG